MVLLDTLVRRGELSFVDWLVEAYYLRMVLRLSRIPHFTTLHYSSQIHRKNQRVHARKDFIARNMRWKRITFEIECSS